MKYLSTRVVLATAALATVSLFGQGTISVPTDYATIQAALGAAAAGDTVVVAPGVYPENLVWPPRNGITLMGEGDSCDVVIDGGDVDRALLFDGFAYDPDSTLVANLTIRNGYGSSSGGGVSVVGATAEGDGVSFRSVEIRDCFSEDEGGGLHVSRADVRFERVRLANNIGGAGGGAWIESSVVAFLDSRVDSNESNSGYGGGVCWYESVVAASRSSFENNVSHGSGGGVKGVLSDVTTTDCLFAGNVVVTGLEGGGADLYHSTCVFENVVFEKNEAEFGAGVYLTQCEVSVAPPFIVRENSGYEGALYVVGSASSRIALDGVEILANDGPAARISDLGYASMTDAVVAGNRASGNSSHIMTRDVDTAIFARSTFVDNEIGSRHYPDGFDIRATDDSTGLYEASACNHAYTDYAIDCFADRAVVDARNSYWGDPSGPFFPDSSLAGDGSKVSGSLRVSPALNVPNPLAPPVPPRGFTLVDYDGASATFAWRPSLLDDFAEFALYEDDDSAGILSFARSLGTDTTATVSVGGVTRHAVASITTDGDTSWYATPVVVDANADYPIASTPDTIDFGDVPVGADSTISLIIENVGGDTLVVLSAELQSERFTATSFADKIAPHSSDTVEITFDPDAVKKYIDTLTTTTNSFVSPTRHVTLRGEGVDPAACRNADGTPKDYALAQNFPNPFNPKTEIRFELPKRSRVKVAVYNLLGERVALLARGEREAGRYRLEFDASALPSGVYFYRINARATDGSRVFRLAKKMVALK